MHYSLYDRLNNFILLIPILQISPLSYVIIVYEVACTFELSFQIRDTGRNKLHCYLRIREIN